MANFEMQLVSRIVREGSIKEVLDWGITQSDFRTQEARAYFKNIYEYFANPASAGTVFGLHTVQHVYPHFILCDDPSVTTAFLCGQVRQSRLCHEAKELASRIVEASPEQIGDTLSGAMSELSRMIELGHQKNTDVSFADGIAGLMSEYEMQERGVNLARMTWPWQVMNEVTGGIQPDDYIVLYGRPKNMKTWGLLVMAAHAFESDKRIVLYTKEMTPANMYKRIAAIIARLPYSELRHGRLSPMERERLEVLRELSRDPELRNRIIILSGRDAGPGGDTVAWLSAKAEKYKPDGLFVDGMYLLSGDPGKKAQADHARVMDISRGLREMVLRLHIPVIATMQANRKAAGHSDANLDEIAYSDALAQDATVAIRTIAEKVTPENPKQTLAMVIGGSREFKLNGFRIYGVPATDFTFKEVMSEVDAENARAQDLPEGVPGKAGVKKRTPKKPVEQAANGSFGALLQEQLHGLG